jgi:hypothetical protein
MKSILCVVNLTESSIKVLTLAATIASSQKAYLTILFPYRLIDHTYRGDAREFRAALEQQARTTFTTFTRNVPLLNSIDFEFKPEIGFAGYIVTSFIQRQKVDMIIIGQQQAHEINDGNALLLEHLIRDSKTPFTIVPDELNIEIV